MVAGCLGVGASASSGASRFLRERKTSRQAGERRGENQGKQERGTKTMGDKGGTKRDENDISKHGKGKQIKLVVISTHTASG